MASSSRSKETKDESSEDDTSHGSDGGSQETIECAVCLQTCVQPVRLPCSHIFCYLCVKGVTHQSKKCAMCRQEIPANYLDNPNLISVESPELAFEGSYQWFYEGKNGWWQYDERTSKEIEAAYQNKEKQCEVLIAGFLYIIDFENNVQIRRCDLSRRRKIKRDLLSIPKKGIAGVRLPSKTSESSECFPQVQSLNLSSDVTHVKDANADQDTPSTSTGPQNTMFGKILKEDRKKVIEHSSKNVTSAVPQAATISVSSINNPLQTIQAAPTVFQVSLISQVQPASVNVAAVPHITIQFTPSITPAPVTCPQTLCVSIPSMHQGQCVPSTSYTTSVSNLPSPISSVASKETAHKSRSKKRCKCCDLSPSQQEKVPKFDKRKD